MPILLWSRSHHFPWWDVQSGKFYLRIYCDKERIFGQFYVFLPKGQNFAFRDIRPSKFGRSQNLVWKKEVVSFLERSYLTVYILYKFAFFVPLLSYDFKELLTLFRENEILFSVIITQFWTTIEIFSGWLWTNRRWVAMEIRTSRRRPVAESYSRNFSTSYVS